MFEEDGERAMNQSYFGDDGYLCLKLRDKGNGREIPGVDVCDCKSSGVGHYLFNDDGTITLTIGGQPAVMNIEYTDKGFILTMAGTPFYMEFQKVKGDNPTAEDIATCDEDCTMKCCGDDSKSKYSIKPAGCQAGKDCVEDKSCCPAKIGCQGRTDESCCPDKGCKIRSNKPTPVPVNKRE